MISQIKAWIGFLTKNSAAMFFASTIDCYFGFGVASLTYLVCCLFKPFVIIFAFIWLYICGWTAYSNAIFPHHHDPYPDHSLWLVRGKWISIITIYGLELVIIDILVGLFNVCVNLWLAKLTRHKLATYSDDFYVKYQIVLIIPLLQLVSQIIFMCLDEELNPNSLEPIILSAMLSPFLTVWRLLLVEYESYDQTMKILTSVLIFFHLICKSFGFMFLLCKILHAFWLSLSSSLNYDRSTRRRIDNHERQNRQRNLLYREVSHSPANENKKKLIKRNGSDATKHELLGMPNLNQENDDNKPEHHISANTESGEQVEPKEKESIISVIKQIQSEQIIQQKKSESELKEGLKKFLHSQLDGKFENLELELKRSQLQQFADTKNQQKLFLQQMQNNSKKKEALNSKIDEIKEDSKQNFDHQNKRTDKQYEGLKKQCNEMKTTITNQTSQIGILHNLVLELKNSDGQLDAANAQGPQLENGDEKDSRECPICYDKIYNVALRNCGHLLCEDCAAKLVTENKKCPTCDKVIIGTLKLYFP